MVSRYVLLAAIAFCATAQADGLLSERIEHEKEASRRWIAITPHNQNYLAPFTYTDVPNQQPMRRAGNDMNLDNVEVKFQLSFKVELLPDDLWQDLNLYFGYTQVSLWQAYNSDHSSPFRETNYEPEIFATLASNLEYFGVRNRLNAIGFVHQSNGRSEPMSRSWNRLYGQFLFEAGDNFVFSLKPWWRIPESSEEDDNPDIHHYMGHAELRGLYKLDEHEFTFMSRNNLESGFSRGAVQLAWSYPLWGNLRSYVQWHSGYGETLIDYNHYQNRLSLGLHWIAGCELKAPNLRSFFNRMCYLLAK